MKAGDRMTFTLMPDGVVIMRVKSKRVSELAGLLHRKGRKSVPVALLSRSCSASKPMSSFDIWYGTISHSSRKHGN